MMLTLSIKNLDSLENGKPTELVIDRQEATIGRSPACDWSLPDPDKFISSKHAKISYQDGGYTYSDLSTNGTFLNGSVERMPAEHRIANGDILQIGRYQIQANLSEETKVEMAPSATEAGSSAEAAPAAEATPPAPAAEETSAAPAGEPDPVSEAAPIANTSTREAIPPATPPAVEPTPVVNQTPDEEALPGVAFSKASEEVWEKMTGDDVDWNRGGFGEPREATMWIPSGASYALGSEAASVVSSSPAAMTQGELDRLVATFIAEAGLTDKDVKDQSPDLILQAARLLKRLVAGLVVMVESRARAKAQMGAETTNLNLEGNNPIKFTRTPEQALARLLNPAERGFMEGEQAIEDAYVDLQAHQVATLRAMQGALRTALNRFSPDAIRRRAELKGIFSRILPTARDAALWQNYEKEFGLVAQESDEAFLDVFAKQFRKAYEEQTRAAKETKGAGTSG